jgi:NADPH2 dehydrogenase
MTRYFKYKTADDVVSDAQLLGHKLCMSPDFSPLFEPVSIGTKLVGNRFCIQPMEGCDGTKDGAPDELTFRRYQRFGAGGAKLIWGEATAIDEAARMNPRQLWIHDGSAASIEMMLIGCRAAHRDVFGTDENLLLGLQLTHSGRYSYRRPQIVMHDPLLDPITIDKSTGRIVDASFPLLSDDDLKRIEDQYLAAAHLAVKVGCDFIDIKQCHRYLLSELLAARIREGQYGGSLENRTRFVLNLIRRIRSELPSLIIASRMNVYDGIPFRKNSDLIGAPVPHQYPLPTGFGVNAIDYKQVDLTEPLQVVKSIVEAGVALINVTMGNPYANPHILRPAEYPPVDGYHAPEHPLLGVLRHFQATAEIQRAFPAVPIVGSGYSWLQEFAIHAAAGNVETRGCTFAGLGRATLSQPDFVHQLMQHGRLNRKTTCRTFSYCTNLMRAKDHPLGQYPTGCPPFDKELYGPIWKEVEGKRAADSK